MDSVTISGNGKLPSAIEIKANIMRTLEPFAGMPINPEWVRRVFPGGLPYDIPPPERIGVSVERKWRSASIFFGNHYTELLYAYACTDGQNNG